jgi:hypothetical protein
MKWPTVTAAGSPRTLSFAGLWTGLTSITDEFGCTRTFTEEEGRELNCVVRAVDTNEFTCSDVTQSAMFDSCNASIAVTEVSGTIVGGAAELRATMQVTSPNCGSTVNCGPTSHVVSGSIQQRDGLMGSL